MNLLIKAGVDFGADLNYTPSMPILAAAAAIGTRDNACSP